MYFLGYTFNQMSLLGLLLLIGVVVDDAIVVLENVYRRREEDPSLDRRTAAIEGTEQVGFAVVAASLTLVSIFGVGAVPRGHRGALLRVVRGGRHGGRAGVAVRLADAHADAVLALPRASQKHGPVYRFFDRLLDGLDRSTGGVLGWALGHRVKVLLATLVVVLSSGCSSRRSARTSSPRRTTAGST